MKRKSNNPAGAFSLIEALVIVIVIGLLAAGFVFLSNAKAQAIRMNCVGNLKDCGIAFVVWASDNQGKLPMEVPKEQGGSLGWPSEGSAFRNFQVMSNELSTPLTIWCPADTRLRATNFIDINNQNISFFVNLDATTNSPKAWLCGDRNVTNSAPPNRSVLILEKSQLPCWTGTMHNNCGNITLVDGSVHQWSSRDLRNALKEASWTNRIELPE